MRWEIIAVRAENRGLAGIQVIAVDLEIDGSDELTSVDREEGPNLNEYVLRGYHTERWAAPIRHLTEDAAAAEIASGTVRYRARVTLGKGKPVRSRWRTYTLPAAP